MSDDVMVTAAIDFGTMYSGYSYSLKSNPDEIRVNKAWAEGVVGRTVTKAPTCVLLEQTPKIDNSGEENVKLLAFGFAAQDRYREGDKENEYFYDEFKMELYKDKLLGSYKKMIKSYNKKHECDATVLFSKTLGFLKDQLLSDMNENLENKLEAKNIQWVLTVPAIWSDGAKRFMRKCAQEGGVVEDEDSERLLVSLEPECAAMYCRGLKKEDVKPPVPDDFAGIPEATKYMVVDCGGGTVDITAHETKDEDDICELFARSSKDWGGRNIDRNFEEKLKAVMGEDLYVKFNTDYGPQFLDLKIKFEQSKGSIKFEESNYTLGLTLPFELDTLCKTMKKKGFAKHVKDSGVNGISVKEGLLTFEKQVIDDMFDPVVNRICNHVVTLLQEPRAQGMNYTFLAGGFSDCGKLQITMKKAATQIQSLKDMRIITPVDAVLTIMKGAVKFGYNPQAISSRRSRLTYGTCIHEPFKPGVHDMKHRVIGKDGNLYCTGIFYPLLGKDEEILQDDVLDFVFQPLWNQQNEVEFNLYSADKYKDTIKHVSDAGVAKDTIKIQLDPNAKYDEKPIRLLIYFGSTELHIQVVDDNDPHKKKGSASLDLLDA